MYAIIDIKFVWVRTQKVGQEAKMGRVRKLKGTSLPEVIASITSGLEFTVGDSISPRWADLAITVEALVMNGYAQYALPDYMLGLDDEGLLGKAVLELGQKGVEALVPLMITNLDRAVGRGELDYLTDTKLVTIVWILAWYWHIRLGGPRPATKGEIRSKPHPVYGAIPEFKCPFCGRVAIPPHYMIRQGQMYDWYVKWLTKHRVVHQFNVKRPKTESVPGAVTKKVGAGTLPKAGSKAKPVTETKEVQKPETKAPTKLGAWNKQK